MGLWLRLQDRVFGVLIAFFAVSSTIGCIVAIVTGHWARVPVQLIIAIVSMFLFVVRRHAWAKAPTPSGGALTVMRYLTLAFGAALVSFVVVIASLPDTSRGTSLPWLIAVAGITIWCTVLLHVGEKPLDGTTAEKLFGSYRTRFFLRLAFAQTIALLAFTFTFLGAPPWIYYLACAISVVRLWTNAAPTRVSLARDQAALEAQGSQLSLVDVLRAGSFNT